MAINIEQQRQQLNKLGAELANLKKDQARLLAASKGGVLKKPDPKSAEVINTNLATASSLVTAKQAEYDALKEILDEAISDSKVVSEEGSADEARLAALAGFKPDQIEEYRADVAKKLAAKKDTKLSKKTAEEEELKSQQMTKELAKAGEFVYQTLDDKGREDLAAQLNVIYGNRFKLPISKFPSVALKEAYTQLLKDRFQRSQDEGKAISVTEFMELATREGTYKGTTGAGEPDIFASISNETEARALINGAFNAELGRDATATEVTKLTKLLNAAENKNPFKTVKGIRTGGLNKEQFLKDEIVKLPEFAKKKTDKVALTGQSILGTAKANGVTLNQTQIDSFAKRVQDGTDIKIIDKEIRGIAGLGMPENVKKLLDQGVDLSTIYSPYKNLMASILELNPESIDLKDPTLRSAIGPDKEMPIYDFEKALRKDYRWQYTDNAKRDVSNVALKVLRDFGFQA